MVSARQPRWKLKMVGGVSRLLHRVPRERERVADDWHLKGPVTQRESRAIETRLHISSRVEWDTFSSDTLVKSHYCSGLMLTGDALGEDLWKGWRCCFQFLSFTTQCIKRRIERNEDIASGRGRRTTARVCSSSFIRSFIQTLSAGAFLSFECRRHFLTGIQNLSMLFCGKFFSLGLGLIVINENLTSWKVLRCFLLSAIRVPLNVWVKKLIDLKCLYCLNIESTVNWRCGAVLSCWPGQDFLFPENAS